MAAWGNALGGYKLQPRIGGKFARRRGAKKLYKARKKANSRAHKARMRGSRKARVRETFTTMPRRSRDVVAGTAAYGFGRYSGSHSVRSYGLQRAKRGAYGMAGRTSATRAMSKGLKRSRNRKAKDDYYRMTGTSRAKRNAMKAGATVGVLAAAAIAHKKGLWSVKAEKLPRGAKSVKVRVGKSYVRGTAKGSIFGSRATSFKQFDFGVSAGRGSKLPSFAAQGMVSRSWPGYTTYDAVAATRKRKKVVMNTVKHQNASRRAARLKGILL